MLEDLAGEFWLRICHKLQSSHQLGCSHLVCLAGEALLPRSPTWLWPGPRCLPTGLSVGLLRAGLPQSQGREESGPKMEATVCLSFHV